MAKNVELVGSYWSLAAGADPTGHKHEYCDHDFLERVQAASHAGFTGMGFWHADLAHLHKRYSFKELSTILKDNGITFIELEFLLNWFIDGEDRAVSDQTRKLLLDAAEALEADHIKVGDFFNHQVPTDKLISEFRQLCDEARERGTNILYEILPEPFSQIHSLDAGLTLTRGAAASNGGLMLDIWHNVRNGTTNQEMVEKLRATDLIGAELNDGPLETDDLYDATVNHRLCVGEGEFDVAGFIDALQSVGYQGPYGVEVLNAELRNWPLDKLAKHIYQTTMSVFNERS